MKRQKYIYKKKEYWALKLKILVVSYFEEKGKKVRGRKVEMKNL